MARKIKYPTALRKHIQRYNLRDKMLSILNLLGKDGQQSSAGATEEAKRQKVDQKDLGKSIFSLIGYEAAIRLVQENHRKGRLTTKNEVKKRTGQRVEMPVLYRDAGLRHPQEARNLRHNIFHEAFMQLIGSHFSDIETSVPTTGEGLTPDLIVKHNKPDWRISVEYKGYRSFTLLSQSEVLKAMRYQKEYGTAWLVTTSTKTVKQMYSGTLDSRKLVNDGLPILERITKMRAYTDEQKENRGIARKGITHLTKHEGEHFRCKLIEASDLLESCKNGNPLKGVSITTGFEFIRMLKEQGLDNAADSVLRVMKLPTNRIHSDTVTSVRLIE